jgi:hypothetical protein
MPTLPLVLCAIADAQLAVVCCCPLYHWYCVLLLMPVFRYALLLMPTLPLVLSAIADASLPLCAVADALVCCC